VGALTTDEVQVIQGALDMVGKTAESVMTPVAKVSLSACFAGPAAAVAGSWMCHWFWLETV
jgi:hypothetical protein